MNKLYRLIAIGHLTINFPIVVIIFGLPILAFKLAETLTLKIILMIISSIIGIIVSWRIWSLLITKWRIWAFNQVNEGNWIKLKELAIKNKLIWEDGSEFEKTEIRTEQENYQIIEISERISELEQIEEIKLDLETSSETIYNINKVEIIFELLSKLLALMVSIYFLMTDSIIFGLALLGVFLFYGTNIFEIIRQIFSRKRFLLLNNNGLKINLKNWKELKWKDIKSIVIRKEEREMIIRYNEGVSEKQIKIELWRFKIQNYNLFTRKMRVYIDRYILNEK